MGNDGSMEKPLLEIDRRQREGITVLDVRGEIIAYTGAQLKEALLEAAGGGAQPHVLVNMQDVGIMDSSGLGALLQAMKQSLPSTLHLYRCTHHVRRVLQITGLDEVFDLHESEEDALAHALGAPASERPVIARM
jgi:anti-anti-sigma factor